MSFAVANARASIRRNGGDACLRIDGNQNNPNNNVSLPQAGD